MKNILQEFNTKLIKKKDINILEYYKISQEIEKLENKFKNINMFNRITYEQPPKYYLQNKIKKDTDNIQENIRMEINPRLWPFSS